MTNLPSSAEHQRNHNRTAVIVCDNFKRDNLTKRSHRKMSQKDGFPPFATPVISFFKNWAMSLLNQCGALTSCKTRQSNKTNK